MPEHALPVAGPLIFRAAWRNGAVFQEALILKFIPDLLRLQLFLLGCGLAAWAVCSGYRLEQATRAFYAAAGVPAVLGQGWVDATAGSVWRNLRMQRDLYAALRVGLSGQPAAIWLDRAAAIAPTVAAKAAVRYAQGVFAARAGQTAAAAMRFNQMRMLLQQAHRADLLPRIAVRVGRTLLVAGDTRDAIRWELLAWSWTRGQSGPLTALAATTLARA